MKTTGPDQPAGTYSCEFISLPAHNSRELLNVFHRAPIRAALHAGLAI